MLFSDKILPHSIAFQHLTHHILAKMFCTYLSVGALPLNSPEDKTSKEKNKCLTSPADFLISHYISHINTGQYQIQ